MKLLRALLVPATVFSMLSLPAATMPAVAQVAPMVRANIYNDNADPRKDIAVAVAKARREHKHVLVDFGGNWCIDCQILDRYMHEPQNQALLNRYYEVVHVSVGHIDKNLDIPIGYGVNIKKGVPALAVLDGRGKVVYAQVPGEAENMSRGNSAAIPEFLNKWKA